MEKPSRTYLFGIDLEDLRTQFKGGEVYPESVPELTYQYLDYLRDKNHRCTFFAVGELIKRYPSLLQDIVAEGHEIACHTLNHTPLDQLNPESFERDCESFINTVEQVCHYSVKGFRAPFFSLTKTTAWAYPILKKLEFEYSSSVLPAANPIYGWSDFGREIREVDGILEIPMTLMSNPLNIPCGGGVYFRVLPNALLKWALRNHDGPLTGYFHPYDIDTQQPFFKHPGIPDKLVFHLMMRYNRKYLLKKLNRFLGNSFEAKSYMQFAADQKALGLR